MIKEYKRNCPECNGEIVYSSLESYCGCKKRNTKCNSCSKKGNRNPFYGKLTWISGKKMDKNFCKKVSDGHKGQIPWITGKHHSDESKSKMRISKINHMENNGMAPRFNKRACDFIEVFNKQNGYNFQHSLNGGEHYIKDLGYFVDGYDGNKNVVFEYDEKHHFDAMGNLKQKDIIRMKEIQNFLGCGFMRYNEKTKELKEY